MQEADTASTSGHSTPTLPPVAKKRRLELNALRFDSPGAAFDQEIDLSSSRRPNRRAASYSSDGKPAAEASNRPSPSLRPLTASIPPTSQAAPPALTSPQKSYAEHPNHRFDTASPSLTDHGDQTAASATSPSSSLLRSPNGKEDIQRRQRRPSQKLREASEEAKRTSGTSPSKSPTARFPPQSLKGSKLQIPSSARRRRLDSAPDHKASKANAAGDGGQEPLDSVKQERIQEIQRQLDDVHNDHDDLVRELFHLTKFITYVGFHPDIAKDDHSHVFEHFRFQNGLNLEAQLASDSSTRLTRRNVSRRMGDLSLRKVSVPSPAFTTSNPTSVKGKEKAVDSPTDNEQDLSTSSRATGHSQRAKKNVEKNSPTSGRAAQSSSSSTTPAPQRQSHKISKAMPLPSPGALNGKAGHQLFRNFHRTQEGLDLTSNLEERQLLELWARMQPRKLPQTPPILLAMHPLQVPRPSQFGGSTRAYLDSFRSLGEGTEDLTLAEAEAIERKDTISHIRIDKAHSEGRMTGEPYSASFLRPPREAIMTRPKQLHDILLESISAHSMSLKHEARHRRHLARKVSRMVQSHWSSKSGDSEKARKAHERHLKSLAKWTVREVNKQWKLAVSIIKTQKAKAEKLERERQGREQLGRILEQSTKYLGEREEDLKRGRLEGGDDSDELITDSATSEESSSGSESESDSASMAGSDSSLESDVYSLEDDGSESEASTQEDGKDTPEAVHATSKAIPVKDTNHLSALQDMNGSHDLDFEDGDSASSDNSHSSHNKREIDSDRKEVLLLQLLSSKSANPEGHTPANESRPSDPAVRTKHPGREVNGKTSPLISEMRNGDASTQRGEQVEEHDASGLEYSAQSGESSGEEETESVDYRVNGDALLVDQEDAVFDREMRADESVSEDSEEDEGLLADADLPLEDLIKGYGYDHAEKWKRDDVEGVIGPHSHDASPVNGYPQLSSEDSSEADLENGDDMNATQSPAPILSPTTRRSELHSTRRSRSVTKASSVASDEESSPQTADAKARGLHPPFLLRGSLRPYQQTGLEWLASLYVNKANGILADEMGLGKTIQTISLLAHLACDKGIWGPHLVIAPTSVMLNWEVEFKKFLPAFKVLSYYGSQKERKEKRIGWNTEHQFNVCITSYQLVLADQHIFRRKPWVYMILDEAHHIKNFRSQRWQTLLGFNSERRLLLTGTPLQNNLMDLWSLMYFLMPNGLTDVAGAGAFANMKDFQEWFSNPLDRAVESGASMDEETRKMVGKLHTILRPFLLRRLKTEVEKELPQKYEHVLYCRLSKRQRFLYNDFMSRAKTRESLASGNYLSIINCLMQLRKVCNHPDLFEVRPISTAFAMKRSVVADFEIKDLIIRKKLLGGQAHEATRNSLLAGSPSFDVSGREHLTPIATRITRRLDASDKLPFVKSAMPAKPSLDLWTIEGYRRTLEQRRHAEEVESWKHKARINRLKTSQHPTYGVTLISKLRQLGESSQLYPSDVVESKRRSFWQRCDNLSKLICSTVMRAERMADVVDRFAIIPPKALARDLPHYALPALSYDTIPTEALTPQFTSTSHQAATKLQIAFPDASLLQYDCGKLQELDALMRRLKAGGHRILIFTQMTKVLDILEAFLNLHGYRYLRLDGSTKIDRRQALTEKFNRDPRIDAFILSTRSGGLGINLTGADTVLFYDLDWNSAIEAQCMDRAHRIGQTRDVHIYRFVSTATIEENMLRKADMKRKLDSVVIQGGEFTTEHLKRGDWRDMLDDGGTSLAGVKVGDGQEGPSAGEERLLAEVEDEEDRLAAQNARQEMALEDDTVTDFVREDVTAPQPEARDSASERGTAVGTISNNKKGDVQMEDEEGDDAEEEEGTVDDYMLHFVESDWEFFGGGGGFKV